MKGGFLYHQKNDLYLHLKCLNIYMKGFIDTTVMEKVAR